MLYFQNDTSQFISSLQFCFRTPSSNDITMNVALGRNPQGNTCCFWAWTLGPILPPGDAGSHLQGPLRRCCILGNLSCSTPCLQFSTEIRTQKHRNGRPILSIYRSGACSTLALQSHSFAGVFGATNSGQRNHVRRDPIAFQDQCYRPLVQSD